MRCWSIDYVSFNESVPANAEAILDHLPLCNAAITANVRLPSISLQELPQRSQIGSYPLAKSYKGYFLVGLS